MVWPDGERFRKWRERRTIAHEQRELKRVLREPGERQEREFKLKRELERAKREAEQLKTETQHLKTLTEIKKARAEIAETKLALAPGLSRIRFKRMTGGRKLLGQLGELGARQAAAFRGEQTQQRPLIGFGPPPRQPRATQPPAPKPLRFGIKLPGASPGPLISPFYPRRKKKER